MTSLGRVGRILAGTIDVSNSSYDKDIQSSNNLKSAGCSTSQNTQFRATEYVDIREQDEQSNASITKMQGM